jgi:hypothetical protein
VLQINRYAAGLQLAGPSSEDASDWQIVNHEDLIPVVDISAPASAFSTGITASDYPTTLASPQSYLQYPPPSPRTPEPYYSDNEVCPQTPEYRPYSGDDADDFNLPIDLKLSPTPIPAVRPPHRRLLLRRSPQPASLPRQAGATSSEADQKDQQTQGDHDRAACAAHGEEE